MKTEDIKVGTTYHGKYGEPRTVTDISDGEIWYVAGSGRPRSCWCSTFAAWIVAVINETAGAKS